MSKLRALVIGYIFYILVNEWYVVTAGHCVARARPSQVTNILFVAILFDTRAIGCPTKQLSPERVVVQLYDRGQKKA